MHNLCCLYTVSCTASCTVLYCPRTARVLPVYCPLLSVYCSCAEYTSPYNVVLYCRVHQVGMYVSRYVGKLPTGTWLRSQLAAALHTPQNGIALAAANRAEA
jgi:hypothetical protein